MPTLSIPDNIYDSLSLLSEILHQHPANYVISSIFYSYKFLGLITPVSLSFFLLFSPCLLAFFYPLLISTTMSQWIKLLLFISYANNYT